MRRPRHIAVTQDLVDTYTDICKLAGGLMAIGYRRSEADFSGLLLGHKLRLQKQKLCELRSMMEARPARGRQCLQQQGCVWWFASCTCDLWQQVRASVLAQSLQQSLSRAGVQAKSQSPLGPSIASSSNHLRSRKGRLVPRLAQCYFSQF